MRIKKTRILSMLMTMVLMCSTVLPIYAEDAAENVVYCYDDNFNSGTFKDGSKMSSAATYEFVEVASNKYVKMIDKSAASGHPQFSAQLDYTAVKNVKKPSGARPGMVIYHTCQTVNVTPEEETVKTLRVK